MIRFIDISNHQGRAGLSDITWLPGQCDAVIAKASEGTSFIDGWCDRYVRQCSDMGLLWGFYHFAGSGSPESESKFFVDNCKGYFGNGIPVLDWEGGQSVNWVNSFVGNVRRLTGIWPWIYANPWRFNQGGVEANCMRWVAAYPPVAHPSFDTAGTWDCPTADGTVGAWQFCSDGRLNGYWGDLDFNLYYGDRESWLRYAGGGNTGHGKDGHGVSVLENDEYKISVVRK